MSVCDVCEGTGVDPGGEVPCVPCDGSGRVTGSVHPEAPAPFVDVLSSALLNATQEPQPWRICDHVHVPHRGHVTGECRNPRAVTVCEWCAETHMGKGFLAPGELDLGVQEARPDTAVNVCRASSRGGSPDMSTEDTQSTLPFAESGSR